MKGWWPAALMATACQGVVTVVQPVEVSGVVETLDDEPGALHIEAYQAWAGKGDLRYPLRRVGQMWQDAPGAYALSVELPAEDGEGLVMYAWQDRDGDGQHCAPGTDDEPAGLVVVSEGAVEDEVTADLLLDTDCIGPTRLFP